jgi:hypothetical protein
VARPVQPVGIAVRNAELTEEPKAFLGVFIRLIEILVEGIGEVVPIVLGLKIIRPLGNKEVVEGSQIVDAFGAVGGDQSLMAAAAGDGDGESNGPAERAPVDERVF